MAEKPANPLSIVPPGGGNSAPTAAVTLAKPTKTAVLVAQHIVDEIVDGGLAPGTNLTAEREMLARYGVSRGTLREALRILETYGLISIKTGPKGGPIVADPGARPLANVIALVLQLNRTSIRSVFDAKVELEPVMAREAAERRTEEDLRALRDSLTNMKSSLNDSAAFAGENDAFHSAVGAAAKNPVLFEVVSSLNWTQDATVVRADLADRNREAILTAHRGIYKAIKTKSPDLAEAAMKVHVRSFADHAERYYSHVLDAPLRWDIVVG